MNGMQCQQCEAAGATSATTALESVSHLMHYSPFRDAEGKEHTHDGNKITTLYECSNGHMCEVSSYRPCWCGWVRGPSSLVPKERETFDEKLREIIKRKAARPAAAKE